MPLISPEATPPAGKRYSGSAIPLLAYVVGVVFTILAGYQTFRQIESLIQQDKLSDLNAIAAMKIGQIASWRESQQRRGDALSRTTLLPSEFEQWSREGAPAGTHQQKIFQMLSGWQQVYGYHAAALVDRQGALRLAEGTGAALDAEEIELARQAMDSRKVMLSDIHIESGDGMISIDLAAPLIVHDENRSRVVGAAMLRINPADFLFPLIQVWPVRTSTAETLLVRQEGESLLFLNVLRHREGNALTLRLPVNTPDLPPGMFLRGKLDPLNSVDYRGVPVVASVSRIPGTAWLMVAKIDKEELFAPIVKLKQWSAAVGLAFLAGCGVLFFVWLQGTQARYRHLRVQRDAAIHNELLLKHFEYLTKYANDIIFVADENHEIVEANERAVSAYGYTRDELLGMPIRALRPPTDDLNVYNEQMARLKEVGELVYETVARRKDGSTFPAEVSSRIIDIWGKKFRQGIIRDISERKAAERRIVRLNELYAAISQTNSAIVRIKDQAALFQEICRIVVEYGHFRLAWVGLIDSEHRRITPVASSGVGAGYLDGLTISFDADEPEGQGPTGAALHQGQTIICKDFETDPRTLPWRDKARQYGLRSSSAWPLLLEGKSVGVLTLYAGEANYFDDDMVPLLSTISQDISFALDNLAIEESLRQSEEKFRTLVENLPQRVFVKDVNSVYVTCNALYARDRNMQPSEIAGKTDFDFYPQEVAEKRRDYDRRVMASGEVEEALERYLQDGQDRVIQVIKAPFKDAQGVVTGVLGVFWDVTERKQAEDTLRLHSEILSNLSEGIFLIRASDGAIVFTNPQVERMFGYELGELLGRHISFVNAPSEKPPEETAAAIISELERTGAWSGDVQNIGKNGAIFWCHANVSAFDHPQFGTVWLSVHEDITQRKLAEDELSRQKSFLRQVIDADPNLIFVKDAAGKLLLANQATARIHGMTPDDMLGDGYLASLKRRDSQAEFYLEMDREVIRKRRPVSFVAPSPVDGEEHWFLTSKTPMVLPDGTVNVLSIAVDITERKRVEEELRESEARFRAMADGAPIIIWMADAQDGQKYSGCGFFNQEWHHFTGLTLVQTQGRNWLELVHPDDRERCLRAYQDAFSLAQPFKHEHRLMRHDGEYRWILDGGVPRFTGDGKLLGFIGTCVDITEQRTADAMRSEIERVGRLNIAVEMASGLAHELSQPLSAANNYLAGCLQRMKDARWDREKLQKAVELTYKQTERAGKIINHLKEFIRDQSHERLTIDINALIRDTINFIEHEIKNHGIVVLMELSTLPLVKVNKIEIEQVLLNLFKNAIEAMHAAPEPVLRITTTAGLHNSEHILVSISDSGHGVPDAELATIFNPFHTSKKSGLGLGLSICRSLVENHGGFIWADAQREFGAEFHFTLPFEADYE